MLTGEAKKQYQRDYMKKKRSNTRSNISDGSNIKLPKIPNITDGSNIIPKVITSPDEVPPKPSKPVAGELMSPESKKKLNLLPTTTQEGIIDVLRARKRLDLFDDSEERIDRAIKYDKWTKRKVLAS